MVHLIYLLMMFVSLMFVGLNHPISMGLLLILHTLLIGLLTGLVSGSFWFSYILFLVFLGGVLVLFIYMTSLASNEKFNFSWFDTFIFLLFIFTVILGVVYSFMPSIDLMSEWGLWGQVGDSVSSFHKSFMKLYTSHSSYLTVFLIFYLLYALVVCANLVGGYPGALRNFN